MQINGLKIHRKISWLLASFSLIEFFIVALFKFLKDNAIFSNLHMIVEWILTGILTIHCILSQKYLKLWWIRIFKGLKSKRARPIYILRVIQLLTNRVIIIFAALVVLSGLGYFEWYVQSIGTIIPYEIHIYYDLSLSILIIIHIAVGFKFLFIRKRIKHWSFNLFIIILSCSLILTLLGLSL
ncbi:MAG: hypothetical protein ACFE8J_07500 [Candidatus Heimdallarchaeota archaeon]